MVCGVSEIGWTSSDPRSAATATTPSLMSKGVISTTPLNRPVKSKPSGENLEGTGSTSAAVRPAKTPWASRQADSSTVPDSADVSPETGMVVEVRPESAYGWVK